MQVYWWKKDAIPLWRMWDMSSWWTEIFPLPIVWHVPAKEAWESAQSMSTYLMKKIILKNYYAGDKTILYLYLFYSVFHKCRGETAQSAWKTCILLGYHLTSLLVVIWSIRLAIMIFFLLVIMLVQFVKPQLWTWNR